MTTPFLAAIAGPDGIRQLQRIDEPVWEFRRPGNEAFDLTDEDLRFLITLAPAIAATLDRAASLAQVGTNTSPGSATTTPRSASADTASQHHPTSATRAPAARSGKPWSDQEDARLIASLQSGAAISKIADAFGRTPGAIVARCLHLDVIEVTFKIAHSTAPVSDGGIDAGLERERTQNQTGA